MDKSNKHCVHCGDEFEPDSRVKDQRYCKKEECQKARRALWQKERLRDDPDYKDNQKRCWKEWYSGHPGYYSVGNNLKGAKTNNGGSIGRYTNPLFTLGIKERWFSLFNIQP